MPPLHIVKAHNGVQYRFYELTGDLDDALHFHDFDVGWRRPKRMASSATGRVRLKGGLEPDASTRSSDSGPSEAGRLSRGRMMAERSCVDGYRAA